MLKQVEQTGFEHFEDQKELSNTKHMLVKNKSWLKEHQIFDRSRGYGRQSTYEEGDEVAVV